MREFLADDRALAWNFVVWGATLIIGALLYIMIQEPAEMIHATATNQSNTSASATGIKWWWQWVEFTPVGILAFGFIQLFAAALYEARGGGGLI